MNTSHISRAYELKTDRDYHLYQSDNVIVASLKAKLFSQFVERSKIKNTDEHARLTEELSCSDEFWVAVCNGDYEQMEVIRHGLMVSIVDSNFYGENNV